MKIIGLGKVFESFDLLKFEKNKFFMVTNINFRKDKEEWLKQLVSISKKMIEDDEEIIDEFKETIIDILKIDLFDENLYINISQHSPDEFMFSFKNVEKREVIIYFYNSKCEYDDNTDLDDFDSFVEKYIKKIELFNKHVAKGVTFIREDAKKEDFIEFIKNFPNSKGILVNYDVKPKFVCRDEIVTEWYIQKPTEVNWEKRNNENLVWDIILRS